MPKKAPPAALSISSPIPRTPDAAYFPSAASPSYRSPSGAYRSPSNPQGGRNVSARPWGRGRDGRADGHGHGDGAADGLGQGQGQGQGGDGLGMGIRGYDDYDLTQSPTHAYLDTLDSYSGSPDPLHTPIPGSPSMDSPALATEKDPLGGGAAFGHNQYPSNRYLDPSLRRTASAGRGNRDRAYKEPRGCVPSDPTKRRWLFFGVPIGLIIAAAIAVGVVVGINQSHKSTSSGGSSGGSSGSGSGSGNGGSTGSTGSGNNGGTSSTVYNTTLWGAAGSGPNGSIVTTDLDVNFTYVNWYGGNWAQDPLNPYSVSGKAQSWSPSLLEDWVWGTDIVRGVNLGGWLVTEPFIVPALYEQYQNATPNAIDEFTLSQALGADLATVMEEHYATFITEQDFADIAKVGLNWVRIPLGFWAIETQAGEPYLEGVSWQYFLKAISWARKYGLRILLDFHGLPGSQNGWNHSGRGIGIVNWMYGVMGITNAQRSLEILRTMVEYISQDGIKQVVPVIGLVNEVQAGVVGMQNLGSFYYQAYNMIRSITGYGAGNGPIIAMHEGFEGIAAWNGFLSGADRLALDQHPYLAFQATQNNNTWAQNTQQACGWGGGTNDSQTTFGIVLGGEWSNAINDCGKWLGGVGSTPAYETTFGAGACTQWEEWMNWSATTKAGILGFSSGQIDALQNWFFWTWKIGNSTQLGYAPSPFWHYKLGVENGWIPTDPRTAGGYCKGINVGGDQFAGTYPASATGGVSSSQALASSSIYSAWPPTSLGPSFINTAQIALFPTLTRTGTPVTLATPSHFYNVTMGGGWAFSSDSQAAYTTVAGCTYPDEYNATASSLVPTALCTGGAARRAVIPGPTPAPVS